MSAHGADFDYWCFNMILAIESLLKGGGMKKAKIVLCLRPTLTGSVVWVDGYAKPWCAIEMRMVRDKTIFKLTRMVGDDGYIHEDSVPTIEEFEADPLVVLTLPEGLDPFQLFGMFAHGFMRDYTKI